MLYYIAELQRTYSELYNAEDLIRADEYRNKFIAKHVYCSNVDVIDSNSLSLSHFQKAT